MSRSVLGLIPVAGVLAACLLSGCSTPEKAAPACVDDACDDDSESDDAETTDDDEKPRDAGSKTTAVKDSGTRVVADAGSKATSASTALPCDVNKLVTEHCGACHGATPAGGAPMSLLTALDFQAALKSGKSVRESVKTRINETDTKKMMPPAGTNALSKDEIATLNAWLDKGASGKTETDTCSVKAPVVAEEEDVIPTLPSDTGPIDTTGLTCHKFLAHNGDGK
ncbi:MAG: hypothetical protein RLZZ450_3163, partial [Pseudomonadota bacterium]